jgi:hypothetical protein
LTGAGVNFINSSIKLQIRLHHSARNFADLVADAKQRQGSQQELRLTKDSWFVVKWIKEQHVYLELITNDYSDEYNGLIFKVKYQHMNARREFLTGKLLNLYVFLDKNKFLPIAYFWLFLLKVNDLVGEKRGYLSSTTYLMMLINYL